VIVKGKKWAPYIVVWMAKIVRKQSYPMARKKIWGGLILKIGFSKIWCMNLFPVEVDRSAQCSLQSIDYLCRSIDMNSKWINRQFW